MSKTLSVLVAAVCLAAAMTGRAQPARTKVMLLDGESGGPYHKWQMTTPLIKASLEETGLFQVDVVTAPAATGVLSDFRPDFAAYKAVVFNYDAPDERWPEPLRASFEQFVNGGGGVVVVHAADNAFSGWKAWNDMIGVGANFTVLVPSPFGVSDTIGMFDTVPLSSGTIIAVSNTAFSEGSSHRGDTRRAYPGSIWLTSIALGSPSRV